MPSDPESSVRRWLNGILHNIDLAESFMAGLDYDAFHQDRLRVCGVTRCLEIIFEASRRLSDDLKARHPWIAWKEMADAGSVYRQDYQEVDAEGGWITVQDRLPPLRVVIGEELANLGRAA